MGGWWWQGGKPKQKCAYVQNDSQRALAIERYRTRNGGHVADEQQSRFRHARIIRLLTIVIKKKTKNEEGSNGGIYMYVVVSMRMCVCVCAWTFRAVGSDAAVVCAGRM